MRQIRFSGLDVETGDVLEFELEELLATSDMYDTIDPKTVRQFVGVDKDDCEVYEGDKLRNPLTGAIFKAQLNHIDAVKKYELAGA